MQKVKFRIGAYHRLSSAARPPLARWVSQTKHALNLSRNGTYLDQEKKICWWPKGIKGNLMQKSRRNGTYLFVKRSHMDQSSMRKFVVMEKRQYSFIICAEFLETYKEIWINDDSKFFESMFQLTIKEDLDFFTAPPCPQICRSWRLVAPSTRLVSTLWGSCGFCSWESGLNNGLWWVFRLPKGPWLWINRVVHCSLFLICMWHFTLLWFASFSFYLNWNFI
jgi:hypothetical protein